MTVDQEPLSSLVVDERELKWIVYSALRMIEEFDKHGLTDQSLIDLHNNAVHTLNEMERRMNEKK